jgi:hypothetical protein
MILNLTQHPATPEQIEAGVVDLDALADYGEGVLVTGHRPDDVRAMLTFDHLPTRVDLRKRAGALANVVAQLVVDDTAVMIGGAPFFMAPLEEALEVRTEARREDGEWIHEEKP